MNKLSELRADIANCLNEAGVRAVDYATNRVTPPLAIVVPADDYIQPRERTGFGHYTITIDVLVLGPNAAAKVAANTMDDFLIKAINALDEEFDIVRVTAPGEAQLDNATYFGAVITIETSFSLGKDD